MKDQAKKLVYQKPAKSLKRKINQALGNDWSDSDRPSSRKKARTNPKTLFGVGSGSSFTSKKTANTSASPGNGHNDGRKARKETSHGSSSKVKDCKVNKRSSSASHAGVSAKKDSARRGWTGWTLLPQGQPRPKTVEDEIRELIENTKSEESKIIKKSKLHKVKAEVSKAEGSSKRATGSALSTAAELYKKKRSSLLSGSTKQPSESASSSTAKLLCSTDNLRQSTLSFSSERFSLDSASASSSPTTKANVGSTSDRSANLSKNSTNIDIVRDGRVSKSPPPLISRPRPTAAQSVTTSIRNAASKSVKGSQRAAAMLKMGLKGDEAVRKAIRQVSGAE